MSIPKGLVEAIKELGEDDLLEVVSLVRETLVDRRAETIKRLSRLEESIRTTGGIRRYSLSSGRGAEIGEKSATIIRLLCERPKLLAREIAAAVKPLGITKKMDVDSALNRLVESGKLVREGSVGSYRYSASEAWAKAVMSE